METTAFSKVRLVIGRIQSAVFFAKARKPAYQLKIDFGPALGTRQSSAQITGGYPDPSFLVGSLVMAVLNFPPRRVAGFQSEVLCLGFHLEETVILLAQPLFPEVGMVGQRVGLVEDAQGRVWVPEEEAETTIDVFMQATALLGEVVQLADGQATVSLGDDRGTCVCPARAGVQRGQRLVVLVAGETGRLLALPSGTPLTASGAIPSGARLL